MSRQAPVEYTDDQIREMMGQGQGMRGSDTGGPPIEMSDDEISAILANKEGVLNPGQGVAAGGVAAGPTTSPDTGLVAGLRRGVSNFTSMFTNPIDTISGLASEAAAFAGPQRATATMLERGKTAMERARGDEHKGTGLDPYLHGAVGMIPLVGGHANQLLERASGGDLTGAMGEATVDVLGGEVMGGVLRRVPSAGRAVTDRVGVTTGRLPAITTDAQINNLAAAAGSTARDVRMVQPLLKEVFQKAGVDPNLIAIKHKTAATGDVLGDLNRGLPKAEYDKFIKSLGKDPNRAAPVAIEAATAAVDFAGRTRRLAAERFGELPTTQIQTNLIGNLQEAIDATSDAGIRNASREILAKVKREGGTVRGLNKILADLNKDGSALYNMSPGKQINASVKPISVYTNTASDIRAELYPLLEAASGNRLGLKEAGAIEHQAIQFRDGIYKEWDNWATQHAAELAKRQNQTWPQWVGEKLKGVNPITKTPIGMGTALGSNFITDSLPLEQFNTLFKNGIGGLEGFTPAPLPQLLRDNPYIMSGRPNTYTPEQLARLAEYKPGVFLPETATPPPTAVAGPPPVGQGAQVRGVDAPVAGQLPMQPSRLDFGSGRVPVTTNQQYGGTATTPPMMKPSGPGTLLTRDPRVLKSTLDAIDKTLQSKVLNDAHRAELMAARAKILAQLQPPSPLAPPPTQ